MNVVLFELHHERQLGGTKNKTKNWVGEDIIDGRNCMKRMWIWKALGCEYNLVSDKGLLDHRYMRKC